MTLMFQVDILFFQFYFVVFAEQELFSSTVLKNLPPKKEE